MRPFKRLYTAANRSLITNPFLAPHQVHPRRETSGCGARRQRRPQSIRRPRQEERGRAVERHRQERLRRVLGRGVVHRVPQHAIRNALRSPCTPPCQCPPPVIRSQVVIRVVQSSTCTLRQASTPLTDAATGLPLTLAAALQTLFQFALPGDAVQVPALLQRAQH
jgi:hypothetical protein